MSTSYFLTRVISKNFKIGLRLYPTQKDVDTAKTTVVNLGFDALNTGGYESLQFYVREIDPELGGAISLREQVLDQDFLPTPESVFTNGVNRLAHEPRLVFDEAFSSQNFFVTVNSDQDIVVTAEYDQIARIPVRASIALLFTTAKPAAVNLQIQRLPRFTPGEMRHFFGDYKDKILSGRQFDPTFESFHANGVNLTL